MGSGCGTMVVSAQFCIGLCRPKNLFLEVNNVFFEITENFSLSIQIVRVAKSVQSICTGSIFPLFSSVEVSLSRQRHGKGSSSVKPV